MYNSAPPPLPSSGYWPWHGMPWPPAPYWPHYTVPGHLAQAHVQPVSSQLPVDAQFQADFHRMMMSLQSKRAQDLSRSSAAIPAVTDATSLPAQHVQEPKISTTVPQMPTRGLPSGTAKVEQATVTAEGVKRFNDPSADLTDTLPSKLVSEKGKPIVTPAGPAPILPISAASDTLAASAKSQTTAFDSSRAELSRGTLEVKAEPLGLSRVDRPPDQDDGIDMYLDLNHNRLSKAETAIAVALRRIFPDARFEKVRPRWLTNTSTNRALELDLFSESLRCAIERSGQQHYVYPNGIHTSRSAFDALQERDRKKAQLCAQFGVTLIHVPWTVSAKETENFLREELRRLNFHPPPQ